MDTEIQKTESPLMAAAALVQANGNMDVEKLGKLLDMQIKWEANEAKKAFVQAMTEFKKDPPEILKDKHVKYGNTEYDHASLNGVTTAINSGLSKCGLSASWITEQTDKGIKVTCKITHILGHSEETSLISPPDSSGGKNPIQAIGSAVSYLRRYTIEAITGVASKDIEDDDGKGTGDTKDNLPGKPNEQQQDVLDAVCKILTSETKKKVLPDTVAALFYTEFKEYPSKLKLVKEAAQWVIDQDKESEWTEQVDMADLTKTLGQAYFEFETEHQGYLADHDGKVEFSEDMFIKAVTKAFGTLPTDKTIKEIIEAVKPEDVAVIVKDE